MQTTQKAYSGGESYSFRKNSIFSILLSLLASTFCDSKLGIKCNFSLVSLISLLLSIICISISFTNIQNCIRCVMIFASIIKYNLRIHKNIHSCYIHSILQHYGSFLLFPECPKFSSISESLRKGLLGTSSHSHSLSGSMLISFILHEYLAECQLPN